MHILSHYIFAGSYDQQFLTVMNNTYIDHLLDDLDSDAFNGFGTRLGVPVASQISHNTYFGFCVRVSSLLGGQLNRLTAEKCRRAYTIIHRYYPDISELQAIYEQLREHYKGTRNPMPLQKR